MNILETILKLLTNYYQGITVTSLIIGGFWGLIKYRETVKDKRFITYHKMIEQLVNEQNQPDKVIKRDQQIAIIYELRNFPGYFDVSIRILEGLKKEWQDQTRVIEEINLSLEYMKRNWFCRFFLRIL